MNFTEIFTDRPFQRKLWKIALPSTFQHLMYALVAAADAFMLGRVDQNSMAAVSLATQVQFVQFMFVWAVATAASILGAQYWGKKDLARLDEIFGITIRQTMLISTVFLVACVFFPRMLMKLFAGDEELIRIGCDYLRIAGWSYLIVGFSIAYVSIMKVTDHVPRAAWISVGTVFLNIVLNAIFIFGLLGVPAMGVKGAALATLLARIIEFFWCVGSSYQKGFLRLKLWTIIHWNPRLLKDFWKCSLPLFGSGLFWGVGFTSYTAVLGHMGPAAAAANSVAAVVRDLMCCLCNGLCNGAGILIGNELGAGNLERGKLYGQRLMVISFIVGILATIVVLASIPPVLAFMKLDADAREYLVGMFCILSIYMIGRCVNTIVINGIFSAGGDTLFDFYSVVVSMWGIAVPCAFLGAFYFHWSVLLVYACTCLDEVGKIPWVMHHFFKYKWVKDLTIKD